MARLFQPLKRWLEGSEKDEHKSKRAATGEGTVWAFVFEHNGGTDAASYKLLFRKNKYSCNVDIADLEDSIVSELERRGYLVPDQISISRDNPFQEATVVDGNFDVIYHVRTGIMTLSNDYLVDEHVDRDSANPFYVLVSKLRERQPAMEIVAGPSAAMRGTTVDPAQQQLALERSVMHQEAQQKYQNMEILTGLDLTAQDCAVPLPCMSKGQARFETDEEGQVKLMHRQIMDDLLGKVDALTTKSGAKINLYVHGPKGVGKSHCLLAAAARLWQRRLKAEGQDAQLRVVYIPEWYSAEINDVIKELLLTFSDDAQIVARLQAAATPANVRNVLETADQTYNIVAILDQVRDSPEDNRTAAPAPSLYFQGCATVVTASSPRFERQDKLLNDASFKTQVFYVPAGLPEGEFDRYLQTRYAEFQFSMEHRTQLYELSGGVPLYINELVAVVHHVLADEDVSEQAKLDEQEEEEHEDLVLSAMDRWSRTTADNMSRAIGEHFDSLTRNRSKDELLSFLSSAISRDSVNMNTAMLKVADLRYVEIENKNNRHYLHPICPAAVLAIIEFLRLHWASQSAARLDQLVGTLIFALNYKGAVSSPSARGYIQETLFLAQLQQHQGSEFTVSHTAKKGEKPAKRSKLSSHPRRYVRASHKGRT